MPTSPPSSIDSPPPFAMPYGDPADDDSARDAPPRGAAGGDRADRDAAAVALSPPPPAAALKWPLALVLFAATVVSILHAGASYAYDGTGPLRLADGVTFAVPLLAILLAHEFGHFAFARIHRVNSSLPLFIPLPFISQFGTLGAVILMRDRIRSRNALVDIGASGPIAGMLVAVPVLLFGLAHSPVHPLEAHGAQEGQCILYWLLKRIAIGPIPAGWDVYLNPVAQAGWVGLLVTMLNLVPVGQLDGGHVAYALLGRRQNRYSQIVRFLLLALFPLNLVIYLAPALRTGDWGHAWPTALSAGLPWVVWFVVLSVLQRAGGAEHPPTEPGELSLARKVIAVVALTLFVLLFMPALEVVY